MNSQLSSVNAASFLGCGLKTIRQVTPGWRKEMTTVTPRDVKEVRCKALGNKGRRVKQVVGIILKKNFNALHMHENVN